MDVGMVGGPVAVCDALLMDTQLPTQQPMDTSAPLPIASPPTVVGTLGVVQLGGRGVVGNGVPPEVPVPVVQPVSAVPAVGVARPLEVVVEPAIPMDSIGLHPSQESLAEESRALASELTAMTETELMNYICPSAFDAGR